MSSSPFEIHTEFNGKLTRVYVGNKTTVWFSYAKPIAFAVSGAGTFKLANEGETQTTRKHLNSIPAHALPTEEFEARLSLLAHGLDDESVNVTNRPSWARAERAIEQGSDVARHNGWAV